MYKSTILALVLCLMCSTAAAQVPIGWTKNPVTTANTARNGTGTVVLVWIAEEDEFVDTVKCFPFGTNAATVGVLIGNNGQAVTDENNNFMVGKEELAATTLGTHADTDVVTFQIGAWFPKGYRIYAQVNATQAAGRQFIAYASRTYQQY